MAVEMLSTIEQRALARTTAWLHAGMPEHEPTVAELEHEDRVKAAKRDPILWEQMYAGLVSGDGLTCRECATSLTARPDHANPLPTDGFGTTDLYVIPLGGGVLTWYVDPPRRVSWMKLGDVDVCRSCLFDPASALARARRRKRTRNRGNYLT